MLEKNDFYEDYASICRTIVNPIRLKIIETIQEDELNVSEIKERIGISMSNLSNHLSALYNAGVIKREKRGQYIYYSLVEKNILNVLQQMKEIVATLAAKKHQRLLSEAGVTVILRK